MEHKLQWNFPYIWVVRKYVLPLRFLYFSLVFDLPFALTVSFENYEATPFSAAFRKISWYIMECGIAFVQRRKKNDKIAN